MASSYTEVSKAIVKGMEAVITDRAQAWFGINGLDNNMIAITATPSDKGPEYEKGWTFTAAPVKGTTHENNLRIVNGNSITGSTYWVADALSITLEKIGQPKIDAHIEDT